MRVKLVGIRSWVSTMRRVMHICALFHEDRVAGSVEGRAEPPALSQHLSIQPRHLRKVGVTTQNWRRWVRICRADQNVHSSICVSVFKYSVRVENYSSQSAKVLDWRCSKSPKPRLPVISSIQRHKQQNLQTWRLLWILLNRLTFWPLMLHVKQSLSCQMKCPICKGYNQTRDRSSACCNIWPLPDFHCSY